jgi:dynein assembly factor with WDR repeat domains 1
LFQIVFNSQGNRLITASRFSNEPKKKSYLIIYSGADKTARIWDPLTGECKQIIEGHTDEIFSCAFNYEGNTIITGMRNFYWLVICIYIFFEIGSKDNTCRIWR